MLSPFRAKRRKLGKKKERRVGLLSVSRSTVLSLHRVRKEGQKMQKKMTQKWKNLKRQQFARDLYIFLGKKPRMFLRAFLRSDLFSHL